MLICIQKINFITNFFLKILQRTSKLVILGNLGIPGQTHLIMIVSVWRNLWCLSTSKNSTSFFSLSLRHCKNISNLLFWVLWISLVTYIQNTITLQKTFKFICWQRNHFNLMIFMEILQRYALLILSTWGMSGYAHLKW